MTVYNKASLVLAESPAYKAGKIQPYYPLTPDVSFDFTRATSATRVNASGNIEKETQNLLLQSNQFDTTWTGNPSNRSITSGFLGYDGSNDAWKLEAESDNNYSVVNQVVSSTGIETFSVYAKAGTSNFFRIQITGGTNTSASYFDLSGSGAVGNNFNEIDAKIESIGNGWFRCSVTGNKTTSSTCVIYVVDADGSTDVTTGKNIYIQDAQLEQGLVARNYQETTTAAFYGGITDNIPRLDYTDSSCPSVLLEPQRTNLIPHSEYFNYSSNSLLTFNSIASPEGLVNAVKIVENTNTNIHGISKTSVFATNASAVVYTISVFAKKNQRDFLQIQTYADSTSINSNGFDLTNGTITGDSTNHKIEDYGNGWYRCSFTVSITQSTGGYNFIRIAIGKVNNSFYYTGDNTSGLYLYGFQVEEGSYATSYIPTYGTSVTRNSEQMIPPSTSYDLSGSFSIFFDFGKTRKTSAGSTHFYWLDTNANDFFLYTNSSGSDGLNVYLPNQGGYVFGSAANDAWNADASKICVTYNATTGRLAYFINGSKYNEQTSVLSFTGNNVGIGIEAGSNNIAEIKKYMFFTQALTDDECIALTTL